MYVAQTNHFIHLNFFSSSALRGADLSSVGMGSAWNVHEHIATPSSAAARGASGRPPEAAVEDVDGDITSI